MLKMIFLKYLFLIDGFLNKKNKWMNNECINVNFYLNKFFFCNFWLIFY